MIVLFLILQSAKHAAAVLRWSLEVSLQAMFRNQTIVGFSAPVNVLMCLNCAFLAFTFICCCGTGLVLNFYSKQFGENRKRNTHPIWLLPFLHLIMWPGNAAERSFLSGTQFLNHGQKASCCEVRQCMVSLQINSHVVNTCL